MDSQITLINPDSAHEPAEVFFISPDSMKDTTISRRGTGEILYTVKTNKVDTVTTVFTYNPDAEIDTPLAVLKRRDILPDTITFHGQHTRNVKDWVKYGGFSSIKFPATFHENEKEYIWKASIVGELSLYAASAPDIPIAWFQVSKKRVIDDKIVAHSAYLALEPESLEIQDVVVVSFLVLEQKMRIAKKLAGLTGPSGALGGMRSA